MNSGSGHFGPDRQPLASVASSKGSHRNFLPATRIRPSLNHPKLNYDSIRQKRFGKNVRDERNRRKNCATPTDARVVSISGLSGTLPPFPTSRLQRSCAVFDAPKNRSTGLTNCDRAIAGFDPRLRCVAFKIEKEFVLSFVDDVCGR